MEFLIDTAESLYVSDRELSELLLQVYVGGGFTDQQTANSLFNATAVRKRGIITAAREKIDMNLTGIIISVTAESPSCRFAKEKEMELHLLAVKSEFRQNGLGRKLVKEAIKNAKKENYSKILLWTQTIMESAHRLYESLDFVHIEEKDFSKNGRDFLYFERTLSN